MKIIKISDKAWKKLWELKIALGHKSLNDVVESLILAVNPFQTADKYQEETK